MSWPPDPDRYLELGDHARLAEEVAARNERRSRLLRASEVATWTGTLEDLAEQRAGVVVRVAGGRTHRGVLVALGRDHIVIRLHDARTALLSVTAVRTVRPEPGVAAAPATGDRSRAAGRTLAAVLDRCREEATPIVVGLEGMEERLSGQVLALGEDVVTFRVAAQDHGVQYLPLSAVHEVVMDA